MHNSFLYMTWGKRKETSKKVKRNKEMKKNKIKKEK
jgi:hypothetical protein